tara:strand:+ start:148 stop:384 length:237 start_codon:yes stop_codon:yes gene_type:complete
MEEDFGHKFNKGDLVTFKSNEEYGKIYYGIVTYITEPPIIDHAGGLQVRWNDGVIATYSFTREDHRAIARNIKIVSCE